MHNKPQKMIFIRGLVFLFIFICLIYSNTLNSAWQLDDYHNITENPAVQLSSLDKDSIIKSIYAAPTKENLYRPVAYLTFGLNWYFGQDEVSGYRIVNIVVHIFTAVFLFFTVLLLFQTSRLKKWDQKNAYFIALLSASLWAVHPIQIQAVTYIVQRMASMAALFYIIGILCYLKARTVSCKRSQLLFVLLCAISYLLAMGSKNNAILLPASLLLLEFLFFQDLTQKRTQKLAVTVFLGIAVAISIIGVFLFLDGNPEKIVKGYENRPFTIFERILTQPRIILFYLSQIFYPVASRFSITHDVMYSTSFFTPWTTLPSIVIVLLFLAVALWRIKKNPILSFAILFYFGNHAIESSIIPLEMIFEHRNYLPSFFLFVPVSIGIKKAFDHYYTAQKPMYYFLIFSVCVVLIGVGTSTYIRNWDWRSAKSIWEDAMQKAPNSARPLHNLAWGYYAPTGQLDKAIELYERALRLQGNQVAFKLPIYNNLANIHYSELQDYEKAIEYSRKAIDILPDHGKANFLLCRSLSKLGHYQSALARLSFLIKNYPKNMEYTFLQGNILLKTNKFEEALSCFQKCLKTVPGNYKYLMGVGLGLTQMGYHKRGYWYLKQAWQVRDKEGELLIALADNRIKAGQIEQAEKWIKRLVNKIGPDTIETFIKESAQDPLGVPAEYDKIGDLASDWLSELSKKYAETSVQLKTFVKQSNDSQ
jgi:tetratricopeptide (TPR) repeat protein